MKVLLFTDGSVDPRSGTGFGACLVTTEEEALAEESAGEIVVKRFDHTSSSKLELQTLLWALSKISAPEITACVDSRLITGLAERRTRLEARDFCARNGNPLRHFELYQQFYAATDRLNLTLIQVRGHSPHAKKDALDRIFTRVDRASRRALREFLRQEKHP